MALDEPSNRLATVATWTIVLSYFVILIEVGERSFVVPSRLIESVLLLAIVGMDFLSRVDEKMPRSPTTLVVVLGLILHSLLGLRGLLEVRPGEATNFVLGTMSYVTYYAVIAVVAKRLVSMDYLTIVLRRSSRGFMLLALAGVVVSYLLDAAYLTNARPGPIYRLQGLLSEPSAWAPVVAFLVIDSLRSRNWRWLAVCSAALVASQSPIVLVVVVISVSIFLLDRVQHPHLRVVAVAAAMCSTLGFAVAALAIDPDRLAGSSNPLFATVGRLLAGVQGREDDALFVLERFRSTQVVLGELETSGQSFWGLGAGASHGYFSEEVGLKAGASLARANSAWVEVAFNFGYLGLLCFAIGVAVVVYRMFGKRHSVMFLMPFVVASLMNSAGGTQLYQFLLIAAVAVLAQRPIEHTPADPHPAGSMALPLDLHRRTPIAREPSNL